MMNKHILFMAIIMASISLSCSKVDAIGGADSDEIRFVAEMPGQTKATPFGFEASDQISLYAVEWNGSVKMPLQVGGNLLNNEIISFDGVTWSGRHPYYWGSNAVDFYAVYPSQGSIQDISAHPFSVALDQTVDGAMESSDLLVAYAEGKTRAEGQVRLSFNHLMSKLKVRLVKGPSFDGDIPADAIAHVYNTITDAMINLSSCSLEKSPYGEHNTILMKKVSSDTFEAILVPQNIENNTPLIEITMGGIAYLLEYAFSFKPGYSYSIDVLLNTSPDQEQIEISIDPGVGDWK